MSHDTPNTRLAWPFDGDTYRYFTNVRAAREPLTTAAGEWGHSVFAVDELYPDVVAERRAILAREPRRAVSLPHMRAAQWDALLFVLTELAETNPDVMTFSIDGDDLAWRNRVTGTDVAFVFGDDDSLPVEPLAFVAGEVGEDLFLLAERDGALRLDAVAATFTGSWSSTFSLGMSFSDLHGPVPRVHGMGMVERTERFILGLAPGEVVRRTNWSIYDSDELDASLEVAHRREPGRAARIAEEGAWGELRLRIEVQHLVRLPLTGAVLFTIDTQLAPIRQLVEVPEWRRQLVAVLGELPDDMADYKNFLTCREQLVAWIADSAPESAETHTALR